MIRSEDLVYEYDNEYDDGTSYAGRALDGLTFDISDGEFISIVGHNGSGKSTLAKHFNALLAPTGGTLWIDGMNTLDDSNILSIRQCTGMVFQNPDNQIVAGVVEEDVAFGPENLGVPTEEIWKRVEESLKTVSMSKKRKKSPNNLSGGQKQRVAIAGVLAMHPKCIVLDEPTAMLDPVGRKEVLDAVYRLNKENGINIILITHNMEETVKSDRIIVMSEGKIVLSGSPNEVFSDVTKLQEYGLELPAATYMAELLREKGIKLPASILSGEELVQEIICAKKGNNGLL